MRHILFLFLVLISSKLNIHDFSKEFSIKSLRSIEHRCPFLEKHLANAELKMECDGNQRTLRIARVLNFDGASYIKDPDAHALKILSDLSKIINEDLTIEKGDTLCKNTMDLTGRCMSLYTLKSSKKFSDAFLKIAPQNDKIDDFYYFFIVSWEAEN